ncbi:MAG TPA: PfkB family carbohydrate kinase, partial [Ramlibacter sp.]|nr:PfkB family carbohydrate kinase [Ramlibacter sp.]
MLDGVMQQARAHVLSLGSVNADFQVRVPRRPEVSETLLGRELVRLSGGKAANVAFICRKLGLDAALFGHVGDDELARQ